MTKYRMHSHIILKSGAEIDNWKTMRTDLPEPDLIKAAEETRTRIRTGMLSNRQDSYVYLESWVILTTEIAAFSMALYRSEDTKWGGCDDTKIFPEETA